MFARWGRFVFRRRWMVLAITLLMLPVSIILLGFGGQFSEGQTGTTTESLKAYSLMDRELPASNPGFALMFSSSSLHARDPAFRAAMLQALAPLRLDLRITSISTPYSGGSQTDRLLSRDGHRALAEIEFKRTVPSYDDAFVSLRDKVHARHLQVLATGNLALNKGFSDATRSDLTRAEVVSLPLALLLLLLVFGSLVAAGLPLGAGILAVIGGLAGTLLVARVLHVSMYAQQIVTMIGLGVAIDYSLFVTSRFREEMRVRSVEAALARTLETAGRAIVFSGLTVAIGLMGMMFFHIGNLGTMGLAGTIVVALAVFYGLTFLPAMLAILGPRINRLHVPFIHPDHAGSDRGFWFSFSRAVMAHPWQVFLPAAGLLIAVGVPAAHIRLAGGDYTALPKNAEARRGFELLIKQFPGGNTNVIPVVVDFAHGSPLTPAHISQLYNLAHWLLRQGNVSRVESVVTLDPALSRAAIIRMAAGPRSALPQGAQTSIHKLTGRHVALLNVYSPLRSSTDAARALIRHLRSAHPPVAGTVLVTGNAAYDIDQISQLLRDAPGAIAFMVIATYLVLFLLLGSVFLPLKAIVMNFLSVSASFGALVLVFQDGHGASLLHFTPNAIETTTPIILFCILFGLSMDYEVMLLSRFKEAYERTGDTAQAVATGLERTGRLITGAAGIMAAVFFSFALADTEIIKAIGLGLGIAVVVDATVVRTLLVPAVMRLMGRWNWWAPAPLTRLHDRLGLAEQGATREATAPAGAAQ